MSILLDKKIHNLCDSAVFSEDTFAYQIDVGCSYYTRLERDQINPLILTLLKVSEALCVNLVELIPKSI